MDLVRGKRLERSVSSWASTRAPRASVSSPAAPSASAWTTPCSCVPRVESLPRELAAAADRVTVVLPWGTLLAAVAMPSVAVLRGIREISGEGPTEVSWRPRGGRFTLHQPPA